MSETPIRTVLLIDDEPDIRKIAELSLRAIGRWTVVVGDSGEDAVALARSSRPDVILLDVVMPGMDGPTTLAALKADPETASIPVIFLTARSRAAEIDELRAMGAAGVIAKPFDPMGLPGEVRRALGET